jgi:hypothetical protein
MHSETHQSLLWIPRPPQTHRNHNLDALKRAMTELIHRVAMHQPLVHSVSKRAPKNLRELKAASTSPLVILGEFSDRTIFGDPSSNHVQRAWHDKLHLELSAETDVLGEWRVAIAQANEASRLMGDTAADWIFSDIFGQTLHMCQYNLFPLDQTGFVHHFVTTGQVARF